MGRLSPSTIEISLAAVRAYRENLRPAEFLAAVADLKLQATAARVPVAWFIPHPTDDCLWQLSANGPWLHYASTRRSFVPWAFWQCLHYGELDCQRVASPGAVRKGKRAFIAWLTRIGAHALAREVVRIRIARDGTMTYSPCFDSPRILFVDEIDAPSTHDTPE